MGGKMFDSMIQKHVMLLYGSAICEIALRNYCTAVLLNV